MSGEIANATSPDSMVLARAQILECEVRLGQAINLVADADYVPYLQESWSCFNGRAYNAAMLCTWSAVSTYIRQVIRRIPLGEEMFAVKYSRLKHKQQEASDTDANSNEEDESDADKIACVSLKMVTDSQLIDVCRDMGVVNLHKDSAFYDWLTRARVRRNSLAHDPWNDRLLDGKDLQERREETVSFVEEAVKYLLSKPIDHQRLVGFATVVDFVGWWRQPLQRDQVHELVQWSIEPAKLLELCHRMYGIYGSANKKIVQDNAKLFVHVIYAGLDHLLRIQIAERAVKSLTDAVGLKAEKKGEHWTYEQQRLESGELMGPASDNFNTWLELDIWKDQSLPAQLRKGFYKAIIHFLDWECEKMRGSGEAPELQLRQLELFVRYAPNPRYLKLVKQRVDELKGGTNANPST